MKREETWICPRCGTKTNTFPATSRRDNETKICTPCGRAEALFDYELAQEVASERAWLNKISKEE